LNAMIPRDSKNPEGEWRWEAQPFELAGERATGRKAERAREPGNEEAKWQAGNDDPGMESVKTGAVAG
jgi:hypothetical protein